MKPYSGLPPPPWQEEAHGAPPYCQNYGDPSYELCGCCGFEFGNDDEPGTSSPVTFRAYRAEWIAGGIRWFDEKKRPAAWVLSDQLRAAGIFVEPAASQPPEPPSGLASGRGSP